MFTSIDKALVAALMGLIYIANHFGLNIGVSEATVSLIVGVLTPVLVHLMPNKRS